MKRAGFVLMVICCGIACLGAIGMRMAAYDAFEEARKMEIAYRWKRAGSLYARAARLDPFDAGYLSGYADFIVRSQAGASDAAGVLERAAGLYEKALMLDPRSANYAVRLGVIRVDQALLCAADQQRTERARVYTEKALDNFAYARANDPSGYNVVYTSGYAPVSVWGLLTAAEKADALGHLRSAITIRPRCMETVFEQVWTATRDARLLLRLVPDTLAANRRLYSFIRHNNIWSVRSEQEERVERLFARESPAGSAHIRAERAEQRARLKSAYQPGHSAVWTGMDESGMNVYMNGNMFWSGTMDTVIDVPAGECVITIGAKGTYALDAWPYMSVSLDDRQIGEGYVDTARTKDFHFTAKTDGGVKVLSVTFLNDAGSIPRGEDRNLYIRRDVLVHKKIDGE